MRDWGEAGRGGETQWLGVALALSWPAAAQEWPTPSPSPAVGSGGPAGGQAEAPVSPGRGFQQRAVPAHRWLFVRAQPPPPAASGTKPLCPQGPSPHPGTAPQLPRAPADTRRRPAPVAGQPG